MITAKDAGECAIRHMANLIHVEDGEGTWYIDACQLSAFVHDSYWYPEGVTLNINEESHLVYRVIARYASPGMINKRKRSMILSVDAECGELRGYKAIEPPRKSYSGIIAASVGVIGIVAIVIAVDILLRHHSIIHHGG